MARTVALVGAALMVVGVVVGFVPVSAEGASCGFAFIGSSQPTRAGFASRTTLHARADATPPEGACLSRLSDRRVLSLELAIGGLLVLSGAVVLGLSRDTAHPSH